MEHFWGINRSQKPLFRIDFLRSFPSKYSFHFFINNFEELHLLIPKNQLKKGLLKSFFKNMQLEGKKQVVPPMVETVTKRLQSFFEIHLSKVNQMVNCAKWDSKGYFFFFLGKNYKVLTSFFLRISSMFSYFPSTFLWINSYCNFLIKKFPLRL